MATGTGFRVLTILTGWALVAACSAGSAVGSRTGTTASGGQGAGSSSGAGGGSGGLTLMVYTNPCDTANAPADCQVTAAPGCGDAKINQPNEDCDDGNSVPGDGCSGICKIEPYYTCPAEGMPCVTTIICGDGKVGPGEACDDGNKAAGDGCAADCRSVEKGYACQAPGMPCVRVHSCGDGTTDANEGCDDGNNSAGDGCSVRCQIEQGFKCSGSPSKCLATVCGDKVKEGAESCDDGNAVPFDGCSASCQLEPSCTATTGCTSSCGDGIVLGANEQCDDGNLRDGDGCSGTCQIESGFTCASNPCVKAANGVCTLTVPALYHDLASSGDKVNAADALKGADGNPDFEPGADNQPAITGMLATMLAADGLPVLASPTSGFPGFIHSPASFNQWYHSAPPNNATYPGSIVLWDKSGTGAGPYVNRWGPNGEPWASYTSISWCANGNAGESCAMCTLAAGQVCLAPCTPWNNGQICTANVTYLDGNPVFFPIDNPKAPPSLIPETRYPAVIPAPVYNGGWSPEPGGAVHNFHFTTQVRYWFKYDPATTATLNFVGDDDVWVFVNRKLALDLGGWHPPLQGAVTLNAAAGTTYGLTSGNVYEIDVFQAERETKGSSFQLTLSGFNLAPSLCTAKCGDNIVSAGEACDKGAANSDTAYNGCTTQCAPGPHCGDGTVQMPDETCDDGMNTGAYGTCAAGCMFGPRCGDGIIQTDQGETCDDGNNVNLDGCSAACKIEQIK